MPEIKPTLKLRGSDHQKLRDAAERELKAGDRRTSGILMSLAFAVEHFASRRRPQLLVLEGDPPLLDLDDETAINLERVVPDADDMAFGEDETVLAPPPALRHPRPRSASGGHIRNLMVKEPTGPTGRVGLGSGIRRPPGR